MPACVGSQPIGCGGEIIRVADAVRQQPIRGRHLVERGRRQGVVDEVDAGGERTFHAGDHDVEIIEGAECDLAHATAFGGLRIDVVEVREAGRIFDLAEQREPVLPDRLFGLRRHAREPLRRQRREGQGKRAAYKGAAGKADRHEASQDVRHQVRCLKIMPERRRIALNLTHVPVTCR